MKREEYAFAYNINGTKLSGIITMTNPSTLVCYCDKENSKLILDALNTPLPPAEGAEEILEKYMQGNQSISMEGKKSRRVAFGSAIRAMQEFATLHAQRLAEKMVEEKLIEFGNIIRDEPNGDIPTLAEYFMRTINLKSR